MSNINNINPILEAVGELDNTVLENTFKQRKKKPIALIVIAAAAAVSLLVGFGAAVRSGIEFDGREHMSFNYFAQPQAHIPSAEELYALGTEVREIRSIDEYGDGELLLTADLSEISKLLNTELLTAPEHFVTGGKMHLIEGNDVIVDISGHGTAARIEYVLTDKETLAPVYIEARLFTSGSSTFGRDYYTLNGKGEDTFNFYEKVMLADGSEAFVGERYSNACEALFCVNGVGYAIEVRKIHIDEMKQILKKLGITAE